MGIDPEREREVGRKEGRDMEGHRTDERWLEDTGGDGAEGGHSNSSTG